MLRIVVGSSTRFSTLIAQHYSYEAAIIGTYSITSTPGGFHKSEGGRILSGTALITGKSIKNSKWNQIMLKCFHIYLTVEESSTFHEVLLLLERTEGFQGREHCTSFGE